MKEFLDKILAPKAVVSTVPKNDLVITRPYLFKSSLQIRKRINRIMNDKLPYCNIQFFSRLSAKLVTFLHLTTKFHHSYVFALSTNLSVVAAVLPIVTKLSIILESECVNTWGFLHSLGKELKMVMVLPLKNIFYSAIKHLILKTSKFLLPTTTALKLR